METSCDPTDSTELRIHPDNIYKAFPDWDRLKEPMKANGLLKVDGKNLAKKARLAPGMPQDRLLCFQLKLEQDDRLLPPP